LETSSRFEAPKEFKRSAEREAESHRSARCLLDLMCQRLGLDDLGATDVLDVGCGIRFTEALLNDSLPIKRYVGVDVYWEMIEFLQNEVDDPRFEYVHLNAHNAMYNPDGEPLTEEMQLPLGDRDFDLICLFSVFTHIVPRDYRTMLKLLRRHARPDGRLIYTLFINELTEGGHGLIDAWARTLDPADSRVREEIERHLDASGTRRIPPFMDLDATHPLRFAVYSEQFARELAEGTGWEVLSVSPPDIHVQHHMVCAPC
jgi:SAM-dependent methyltransferase